MAHDRNKKIEDRRKWYRELAQERDEEDTRRNYNRVENITGVYCRKEWRFPWEDHSGLEVGTEYRVTHIGVFRACSLIKLEGFGNQEFNSGCFDFYENGEPLDMGLHHERFVAPYLRNMSRETRGNEFIPCVSMDESFDLANKQVYRFPIDRYSHHLREADRVKLTVEDSSRYQRGTILRVEDGSLLIHTDKPLEERGDYSITLL